MDRLTWLLVLVALSAIFAQSYGNLDSLQLKVPVTLKLVNGHFQPVFDSETLDREAKNLIRTAFTRSSANSERSDGVSRVSDQLSESEKDRSGNIGGSEPTETALQGAPRYVNYNNIPERESEREKRDELINTQPKRKVNGCGLDIKIRGNVDPAKLIKFLLKILNREPYWPTTPAPITETPSTEVPTSTIKPLTEASTTEYQDSPNGTPLHLIDPYQSTSTETTDINRNVINLLQEVSDVFSTHFRHNTQITRLLGTLHRLLGWQGDSDKKTEILAMLKEIGKSVKEYKQSLLDNPSLVEKSFETIRTYMQLLNDVERKKTRKPFDTLLRKLNKFLEAQSSNTETKPDEGNDIKPLYVQLVKTFSDKFDSLKETFANQIESLTKQISEYKRELQNTKNTGSVVSFSDLLSVFVKVLKENIDKVPADFLREFIDLSEKYFNKEALRSNAERSPDASGWHMTLINHKYGNFGEIVTKFTRIVHSNPRVVPATFINRFDDLCGKFLERTKPAPVVGTSRVGLETLKELFRVAGYKNEKPASLVWPEGSSELREPIKTDVEANQAKGKQEDTPSPPRPPIDVLKDLLKSKQSATWNPVAALKELLIGKLSTFRTTNVEPSNNQNEESNNNEQIPPESGRSGENSPSNGGLSESSITTESSPATTEANQNVEDTTKLPVQSEATSTAVTEEPTKSTAASYEKVNDGVTAAGNEKIEEATTSPSPNQKPVEPEKEPTTEKPKTPATDLSELLKIVKEIAKKVTTLVNSFHKPGEASNKENTVNPKDPIAELKELFKPLYECVMNVLKKFSSKTKTPDLSSSQPSDLFKPVWSLVDNLKKFLGNKVLPALGNEKEDSSASQEKPTESLSQMISKIMESLKSILNNHSGKAVKHIVINIMQPSLPLSLNETVKRGKENPPPTGDDKLVAIQQTMQKILENIQQMNTKKPSSPAGAVLESFKNILGDDFEKITKSAVSNIWSKLSPKIVPSVSSSEASQTSADVKKAIEGLKLQAEHYKQLFLSMYKKVSDLLKQKPVPFIDTLSSAVGGLNNVLDGIVQKVKKQGTDPKPTPQKMIVEAIRRVVKNLYSSLENMSSSNSDNVALSIVKTITAVQTKLKETLETITSTYSRLSPKVFKDTFLDILSPKKTKQTQEKEDPYQLPGKIYKVVHDIMDENPDDENHKFFRYFTRLYKKIGYSLEEKPEEFVHLFVESVLQLSYKIPQTVEKYIVRFYRIFKDIYSTVSDKLKAGHTDDFLKVLNKLSMRLNYTLGKRSEKSFKKEFIRMWYEKFDNNFNDIYHYFAERGSLDDQQEYAGRIYRKAKTENLLTIDNYPDEEQQLNKLLEEKLGSKYSDNDPKLNAKFMKVYKQMHRDLKSTLDSYLPQYYALFVRTYEIVKKEELTANEEDFIKIFIVSSRELFGNDGKLFYKNSKYFQPYFYRAWKLAVQENESSKIYNEVSQEAETAKHPTDKIGQLIDDLFDESLGITKEEYKKIFLKLYKLFGSNFISGPSKNINHFIKLYNELIKAGSGNAADLSHLLARIFRIVFVEKTYNYIKGWKSLNDYVISYWQKHLRDISATALHTSLLETLNKVRPLDHVISSLYYDKPFLLKLANVKLIDPAETLIQYLEANRILVKELGGHYQKLPAEATYLFVRTYVGLKNVLGTVVDNNISTIFAVYQIVYTPDDPNVLDNRKEFVEILIKANLNHIGQDGTGPEVVPIIVRYFNEEWKNFVDHKSNIKRILGVISTHDFSEPRIVEPPPRPPTVLLIRPAPIEPAPTQVPRPVILNVNYHQRIPTYLIPTVQHIATNYFPGLESKLYELTSDVLQQNVGILSQTPVDILRYLVAVYSHRFNSPSLLTYLPDILNYHSSVLSQLNKKIDNVDELYGNLYKRLSKSLGDKLERHSKKLHSIVRKLYKVVRGKLKQRDFIDTFVESYKKLKEVFGNKAEPTVKYFAPQFINFSNSMDHYEINKNINVTEGKEECCTPAPITTTPVSVTNVNSEEERTRQPTTPSKPTEPESPTKPTEPTPTIPTSSTPEPEENKTESHNSGDVQSGMDVFNVSKHTEHFHHTSEHVMKESQKFQDVFFDIFNILHDKDHDFDRHSEDLYDILKQINLLYEYKTMGDASFKKFLVNDFNETYVTKSTGNRSDDFHVLRRLSNEYHHANLVDVINNKDISSVPVQIISKLVEHGFDQICLAYASNELKENIGNVFFNHHNNKTLADIWFGKLMELYGTCFVDFMKTQPGQQSDFYVNIGSQDLNLQALYFRTWYVMLATEVVKLSDRSEIRTIYPLLLQTYSKLKHDNIPLNSSSADFIYIFTNFYRQSKNEDEDLSSPNEAAKFVDKVADIYTKVYNSQSKTPANIATDQSSAYKALLDRFGVIYPDKLKSEEEQSNFKTFFDTFFKLYESRRYNQDLFIDGLTDPKPNIPGNLEKSLKSLFKKGVLFNKTYDNYYRLYDLPWHSVEYLDAQKHFADSKLSKVFDHIMKEMHNDYGHMYDYDLSFIKDFLAPLHEKYEITETNKKKYYEAFMRVFTQTISKNERLSKDTFLKKIQLELKEEVNAEENTPEYKEFSKLYDKLNIKTITREKFIKYSKKVKKELGDNWDIQSYEHGFQTAFGTGRKIEHPYPIEFWRTYDESYIKIKPDWRGLEYANALVSLKTHPALLTAFETIFDALYEEMGQDAFYLADFVKNVLRRIDTLLSYQNFAQYFLEFFHDYTGGYNDVTGFVNGVQDFFQRTLNFYLLKGTTNGQAINATYIEDCDDKDGHPIFFKRHLTQTQRQVICKEHTEQDTYTDENLKNALNGWLKAERTSRIVSRKAQASKT